EVSITTATGSSLIWASAFCPPSAVMTRKSSPPKVISRTLRIVALSSTARRVLGTSVLHPRRRGIFRRLCGPGTHSVKQVLKAAAHLVARPNRAETVPPELAGPLDRAVRGVFGVSWGKARGWIESGKVRVGVETVTEATARVAAGASLEVDERARRPRAAELDDRQVVHLDAQVLVLN